MTHRITSALWLPVPHCSSFRQDQKTVPGISPTRTEQESQTELFDKVGKKLPAELEEQRQLLIKSFS